MEHEEIAKALFLAILQAHWGHFNAICFGRNNFQGTQYFVESETYWQRTQSLQVGDTVIASVKQGQYPYVDMVGKLLAYDSRTCCGSLLNIKGEIVPWENVRFIGLGSLNQ